MTEDQDMFKLLFMIRRIQLAVSCSVLLGIIISILIRKLYVYNTIRLFMFVCLFNLIGMAIVLAHDPFYITKSCYQLQTEGECSLQNIRLDNVQCGMEAFINLFSYCLGYFFAVLISYNVYLVTKDRHQDFMRKVFYNKKVITFLIILFFIYMLPFIFVFIQNQPSYGPTGFFNPISQNQCKFLFFCGLVGEDKSTTIYYVLFCFLFLAVLYLFILHLLVLIRVNKNMNRFLDMDYLNSKQRFVVMSGKIGWYCFYIQLMNFTKQIVTVVLSNNITRSSDNNPHLGLSWFLLIFNYAFDLYPFLLLFAYVFYTRKQQKIKDSRTLLTSQSE